MTIEGGIVKGPWFRDGNGKAVRTFSTQEKLTFSWGDRVVRALNPTREISVAQGGLRPGVEIRGYATHFRMQSVSAGLVKEVGLKHESPITVSFKHKGRRYQARFKYTEDQARSNI